MLSTLCGAALLFAMESSPYFPLKVGTEWAYTVNFGLNIVSVTQVLRILDHIEIQGRTLVPMESLINDQRQSQYTRRY